ncbi:MAG: 2-C-methyl-D-erythritol 4-phosphate cytidylyltransferase, partial [Lachnospiraceae bacterium]|nr:2-C-methyl-D-erythritol 4-phosphate cytidylyltransferase [Lachnospiraceae bacterium]
LAEGAQGGWSAAPLIRELGITDDAAAAEKMCGQRVKLIESSYRNFKITTPEDMDQAWAIAMELQEKWDASLLQISVE